MLVLTMIQVQVSKPQKGIVQEIAADNQKFWIRCLIQEVRGVEKNLEGVKKTSHYDAMAYVNEQTNQYEFLRKLENSKRNHGCSMSVYSSHPAREKEIEEEAGSVPLESLLVRLHSSPWEKIKPARKQNK